MSLSDNGPAGSSSQASNAQFDSLVKMMGEMQAQLNASIEGVKAHVSESHQGLTQSQDNAVQQLTKQIQLMNTQTKEEIRAEVKKDMEAHNANLMKHIDALNTRVDIMSRDASSSMDDTTGPLPKRARSIPSGGPGPAAASGPVGVPGVKMERAWVKGLPRSLVNKSLEKIADSVLADHAAWG